MGRKRAPHTEKLRQTPAEDLLLKFAATVENLNTRRAYLNAATHFLTHYQNPTLDTLRTITPTEIDQYLSDCVAAFSVRTAKQRLTAIRRLIDWAKDDCENMSNPAMTVESPKLGERDQKPTTLTPGEARKLIESIQPSSQIDLRDRAFIAMLYATSATISSTLELNIADVDRMTDGPKIGEAVSAEQRARAALSDDALVHILAYINSLATKITPAAPIFRATKTDQSELATHRLNRREAYRIVQIRAHKCGIRVHISNQSFVWK